MSEVQKFEATFLVKGVMGGKCVSSGTCVLAADHDAAISALQSRLDAAEREKSALRHALEVKEEFYQDALHSHIVLNAKVAERDALLRDAAKWMRGVSGHYGAQNTFADRIDALLSSAEPVTSREDSMVVIECDGHGTPKVWCDPEIADLVGALNSSGIRTVASCSGHGVRPGVIALADRRELIIAADYETARLVEGYFQGINGESPRNSVPSGHSAEPVKCDTCNGHGLIGDLPIECPDCCVDEPAKGGDGGAGNA